MTVDHWQWLAIGILWALWLLQRIAVMPIIDRRLRATEELAASAMAEAAEASNLADQAETAARRNG